MFSQLWWEKAPEELLDARFTQTFGTIKHTNKPLISVKQNEKATIKCTPIWTQYSSLFKLTKLLKCILLFYQVETDIF